MPVKPTSYQLPNLLFTEAISAECATSCEAFGVCGGSRITAPCGCTWSIESGRRFQCDRCELICRQIKQVDPDTGLLGELSYESHIAKGYSLEQTTINHDLLPEFPVFIPMHTQDFKGGIIPLRWVAADIRWVFNVRGKGAATLKKCFSTATGTRQYLKVDENCQLLLVLNGEDGILEKFWKMPRQIAFQQLVAMGFSVSTGATFSVTPLTTQGTLVPFAHHSAMLMRHHRVLAETQAAGMCSAPNLYWLDGDQREIQRWASWLKLNSGIKTVSRDFTSTSHPTVVARKMTELIYLLELAGRTFHVHIVGTGYVNAPSIASTLAEAGHTVTIVSAAPIMKAQSGGKYDLNDAGEIVESSCNSKEYPFHQLILHNISVFEKRLFLAIEGTFAAQKAVANLYSLTA